MQTYDEVYAKDTFYWGTEPNSMCYTVTDLLQPAGVAGKTVFDLGCGEGKDIIYFAKQGMVATGVDISRPGLDKAKRWAAEENLSIDVVQADLGTFRLSHDVDVVYSSGSLTYIPPQHREAAFENFKKHTRSGGLNAFNAFVEKPYLVTPPDWGDDEYFYRSGDLLRFYWDWEVVSFSEITFDCDSSGVPHRHTMDILIARKP